MSRATSEDMGGRPLRIPIGPATLEGDLEIPERARGVVLFAHGSGSSRHSPRNRYVARVLNAAALAALLTDLLTAEEEAVDLCTGHLQFDIGLLAGRVVGATDWLAREPETTGFPIGYFGASTGAAAAVGAAAERPEEVGAVVSRGGRPDLAGDALAWVRVPTLQIVGGRDEPVIALNRQALAQLGAAEKQLVIIRGATHLFEKPGALERVARLATDWLTRHLSRAAEARVGGTYGRG